MTGPATREGSVGHPGPNSTTPRPRQEQVTRPRPRRLLPSTLHRYHGRAVHSSLGHHLDGVDLDRVYRGGCLNSLTHALACWSPGRSRAHRGLPLSSGTTTLAHRGQRLTRSPGPPRRPGHSQRTRRRARRRGRRIALARVGAEVHRQAQGLARAVRVGSCARRARQNQGARDLPGGVR